MRLTLESVLALALLLAVLLVNGFGLRAELEISRVHQNDNASHYPWWRAWWKRPGTAATRWISGAPNGRWATPCREPASRCGGDRNAIPGFVGTPPVTAGAIVAGVIGVSNYRAAPRSRTNSYRSRVAAI
jgi:hypothetical protein